MAKELYVYLLIVLWNSVSLGDTNDDLYLPGYNLKEIERAYRGQNGPLERPCPVYDLLCIRRYLARHSNCKIAEGPIPDPVYNTAISTFYPSFNITVTQLDISLGGLSGSTVSEFSINRKSQVTVLKVDIRNLRVKGRKIFFRYHRRAQEPAVTSSNTDDEFFPSFSITTVFKGVDNISLADSESVVFFDTAGIVVVGKEAGEHSDPSIAVRFAVYMSNPYRVLQEAYLTAASFYASIIIQNVLCDFGLKITYSTT